jgi:hypothetical protein
LLKTADSTGSYRVSLVGIAGEKEILRLIKLYGTLLQKTEYKAVFLIYTYRTINPQ